MHAYSFEDLREAIRNMERRLGLLDRAEASCCGVTLAQCHALAEIGRRRTVSLNALAALMGVDKSTMSRNISRMEQLELVERVPEPADRRSINITLSASGRKAFQIIENLMNSYYQNVWDSIPGDKRLQVLESLEILEHALAAHECCRNGQDWQLIKEEL